MTPIRLSFFTAVALAGVLNSGREVVVERLLLGADGEGSALQKLSPGRRRR
jgi:hypothetical protein